MLKCLEYLNYGLLKEEMYLNLIKVKLCTISLKQNLTTTHTSVMFPVSTFIIMYSMDVSLVSFLQHKERPKLNKAFDSIVLKNEQNKDLFSLDLQKQMPVTSYPFILEFLTLQTFGPTDNNSRPSWSLTFLSCVPDIR